MAAPRIPTLLSLALLLGACDGEPRPVAPPEPPPPGDPAAAQVVSGSWQSGVVASELPEPLVARVLDTKGTPVPGVRVLWSADSAAGKVADSVTITGPDGTARTRWTLGTRAGAQQAGARIAPPGGGAPAVAVFQASARGGAPRGLSPGWRTMSGELGVPVPLGIAVFDQYGNRAPGALVRWSVLGGGGTMNPEVTYTDSLGVAGTKWMMGMRVGEIQTALVQVGNLGFVYYGTPTLPQTAMITRVSGDAQTAAAGTGLPQPLVLEVRLADGRPVPGAFVQWTATVAGDSISPRYSQTDDSGRVSVRWTLGAQPGAHAALATVDRRSAASATFTATAAAPGAAPR